MPFGAIPFVPFILKRLFLLEILSHQEIFILAKYIGNKISAGAIVNKTDGVVGISNVFNHADNNNWREMVNYIRKNISEEPIVGYERGENLALAKQSGFQSLGQLKVWQK
jgi:hypothetical protein